MLRFVLILLASFSLFSCKKNNTTKINGNLSSYNGKDSVFLFTIWEYGDLYTSSSSLMPLRASGIDSTGNFEFVLDSLPCENCIYRIQVSPQRDWLIKNKLAFFELQDGIELNIKADLSDFENSVQIEKPDGFWDFTDIRDIRLPTNLEVKEIISRKKHLRKESGIDFDSLNKATTDQIIKAYAQTNDVLQKYTIESSNYFDKFMGLKEYEYGSNENLHVFNSKVFASIDRDSFGHIYTEQLRREIEKLAARLKVGDTAPKFSLPNTDDDTVSFYNITGNLILLDFWASWCKPCRKECKSTLSPLFEKYKDDGFEIVSISRDSQRKNWLKAIEQDKMSWTNLIIQDSQLVETYSAERIPTYYLVEGDSKKILAINLRGSDLEAFVDKYYSR